MNYHVRTGNPEWAKSLKKTFGPQFPAVVHGCVDEGEWAVYGDDERLKGPYPITLTSRTDARNRLKEFGALAVSSKVVPMVREVAAPALEVVKPVKAAEVLTLDKVTKKLKSLSGEFVSNYFEIGRWLVEAKKLVGHGNWLDYLENVVHISDRYARVFMRIHEEYGSNRKSIADLTITQVGLLLEAPVEARPTLIEVARTKPVRVLRKAVRLVRAPVAKVQDNPVVSSTLPEPPLVPSPPSEAPEPLPVTPAPAVSQPPIEPPKPVPKTPKPTPAPIVAITVRPADADERHINEEKALSANKAISAIMDAIVNNREHIDTAQGKECGDWIDLKALYELDDTLKQIREVLDRIARDCARKPTDPDRRKSK